jgi:D-3-phosphoglycerate dehydrogenase
MVERFRVALSSDFLRPDGSPAFPTFDRTPLSAHPNLEWAYLKQGMGPVDAAELEGYDALILLAQRFARESVPRGGRLAMVARFGVGYDSVDVEACSDNGIALVITPDGVRRPVAVAIIALMLAVTGKLLVKDRLARQGAPGFAQKINHMGYGLVGRTLGSVGLGNIGAEMFRLARPLDMRFMASDPYADAALAADLGVRLVDLETLFREADVLAVNCLLNEETRHIVNARRLALMKPTAYLINTSRGGTVDQKALTEALEHGRIAGAGLDVLDPEPPSADDPIFKLDNVVLNPHALCWTDQCFAGMGAADVAAVFDLMAGRPPRGIVNRAIVYSELWRAKVERFRARFGG